jgi:hypothetical protein
VVGAIGEERLDRRRRSLGSYQSYPRGLVVPPLAAITYLLRLAGISWDRVDLCVCGRSMTLCREALLERVPFPADRVVEPPLPGHHLAHAYSAYGTAPFANCAVLVLDEQGHHIDSAFEKCTWYEGATGPLTLVDRFFGGGDDLISGCCCTTRLRGDESDRGRQSRPEADGTRGPGKTAPRVAAARVLGQRARGHSGVAATSRRVPGIRGTAKACADPRGPPAAIGGPSVLRARSMGHATGGRPRAQGAGRARARRSAHRCGLPSAIFGRHAVLRGRRRSELYDQPSIARGGLEGRHSSGGDRHGKRSGWRCTDG